jgi:hypothetical protein
MKTTTPPSGAEQDGLLDTLVEWIDIERTPRGAVAAPTLLDEELYLARPIRKGNRYPRQKNYHGYYYFSQVGRHVWHESLLEASILSWLDLHEDIIAIASQPMKMTFPDATFHYPDFIAMHSDNRQVVYDIKPTSRMTDKVFTQFANTHEACKQVGWGYEVRSELPKQVEINLAWVGGFRHPGYHPGQNATAQLLSSLTDTSTIADAIEGIGITSAPHARSAIYHLVSARVLALDLTQPLSDSTPVKKVPNAHS